MLAGLDHVDKGDFQRTGQFSDLFDALEDIHRGLVEIVDENEGFPPIQLNLLDLREQFDDVARIAQCAIQKFSEQGVLKILVANNQNLP